MNIPNGFSSVLCRGYLKALSKHCQKNTVFKVECSNFYMQNDYNSSYNESEIAQKSKKLLLNVDGVCQYRLNKLQYELCWIQCFQYVYNCNRFPNCIATKL